MRLPEELRYAEAAIREKVGAAIGRGKVDCRVSLTRDTADTLPRINPDGLEQLAALCRQAQAALPQAGPMSLGDVLRWPGVMESAAADPEAWRAPLLAALDEALVGLRKAREREGAALRTALLERCDGIAAIVARLKEAMPRILADTERRLQERLAQGLGAALGAGGTITREELTDRIRQEVTLQGVRSDVAEEMDRLMAHVTEVRRSLCAGGAVGRRLDFLMQELNREANTVASKATAIDMTNAAVELKLLIEQMREQVQNLE